MTSSAGRLFDAVAALLCVRDEVNYEGQAAIELEQLADPAEKSTYHAPLTGDAPLRIKEPELVAAAADDPATGTERPVVAARFHYGLAAAVVAARGRLRDERGLNVVVPSGGVFQNLLLQEAGDRSGARQVPGAPAQPDTVQRRRHQPRPGGCRPKGCPGSNSLAQRDLRPQRVLLMRDEY